MHVSSSESLTTEEQAQRQWKQPGGEARCTAMGRRLERMSRLRSGGEPGNITYISLIATPFCQHCSAEHLTLTHQGGKKTEILFKHK